MHKEFLPEDDEKPKPENDRIPEDEVVDAWRSVPEGARRAIIAVWVLLAAGIALYYFSLSEHYWAKGMTRSQFRPWAISIVLGYWVAVALGIWVWLGFRKK